MNQGRGANNNHQKLCSILLKKKPSKKDPDLTCESTQVIAEYPFAHSKSESNPVLTRYRSTTRTKQHFPNPNKLNFDDPETIALKQA